LFKDLPDDERTKELRQRGLSILDISRLIGKNKKLISELVEDINPLNDDKKVYI
jgi:hypothetical protein